MWQTASNYLLVKVEPLCLCGNVEAWSLKFQISGPKPLLYIWSSQSPGAKMARRAPSRGVFKTVPFRMPLIQLLSHHLFYSVRCFWRRLGNISSLGCPCCCSKRRGLPWFPLIFDFSLFPSAFCSGLDTFLLQQAWRSSMTWKDPAKALNGNNYITMINLYNEVNQNLRCWWILPQKLTRLGADFPSPHYLVSSPAWAFAHNISICGCQGFDHSNFLCSLGAGSQFIKTFRLLSCNL